MRKPALMVIGFVMKYYKVIGSILLFILGCFAEWQSFAHMVPPTFMSAALFWLGLLFIFTGLLYPATQLGLLDQLFPLDEDYD
jgi:hypothetical protein